VIESNSSTPISTPARETIAISLILDRFRVEARFKGKKGAAGLRFERRGLERKICTEGL
jgi:hypothetical protein